MGKLRGVLPVSLANKSAFTWVMWTVSRLSEGGLIIFSCFDCASGSLILTLHLRRSIKRVHSPLIATLNFLYQRIFIKSLIIELGDVHIYPSQASVIRLIPTRTLRIHLAILLLHNIALEDSDFSVIRVWLRDPWLVFG
jgi:hypothetical protein